MAQKRVMVKLSEQRQNGEFKCYKRMIGGKLFYLSQDRSEATRMALALEARFKELRRNGQGWTPQIVDEVLAPFRPEMVRPASPARSQNLYAAIDAYLQAYRGRVTAGNFPHLRGKDGGGGDD